MKIDIIIPAYNAIDTIDTPLASIKKQKNVADLHVCIVNDGSDYSYQSIIKKYSPFFDIEEVSLPKNVGPGEARNQGILHTQQDYLLFLDSDDYLYTDHAVLDLYSQITNPMQDLIVSNFYYERDGKCLVMEKSFTWLHGKIFYRKFLLDNHLLFPPTRANEDNGFLRLILFHKPHFSYLNEITYCYHENPNSITRKNNREYKLYGLEGYSSNMLWAMREGIDRGCDISLITTTAMSVLISMYFYYMELSSFPEVSLILSWSKDILLLYEQYPNYAVDAFRVQQMLQNKKEEYIRENTSYSDFLSFDEFLESIKKDS